MSDPVQEQIKTILQAQIIQALNDMPNAIEKMVKAALSAPVDAYSGEEPTSYSKQQVPYIDFMVGDEIRQAAQIAARKVIQEKIPDIEAMVRKGLTSESVVGAVTSALVGATKNDWSIKVSFEKEQQ